ncbi:GtrA family protein [Sediminicoccus sp. BL-A-41-H5]|uniref:GtrA family protein n=1 Tax=Sediminicoccus sp. BL-A-41-H5 TaxID=3421106 RepID=UPI003D663C2E
MQLTPELLRFVLSGGAAAAANVLARILFSQVMPYSPAIILAYGVGMLTAYLLMRRFVFERSGRGTREEAGRFILVNAVAAAQVWAVSILLARWLLPALGWSWQAETLAHMAGVGSTVLTSYAMHKAFTFRRKGDA